MENKSLKYFLAANSGEGFVSYFADNYDFNSGWRAYIIKGGPGTGKSSFMKRVATEAVNKGYCVQLCPCSSDPDSLDGVIIESIKAIILDGTAPHVVEPKYVGVCEEIINLGEFWCNDKLQKNAKDIITVTSQNKNLHKTAAAYISAAAKLMYNNFKIAQCLTEVKKVESFAEKLAEKLIPKQRDKAPKEWTRFIAGVTPNGVIAFENTIQDFYKNIIVVSDKYGSVANEIMKIARKTALDRGYEIITLKNPLLPSKIIDHVLIPKLSVAFVREYEYINFAKSYRRIHAHRFYDKNALRQRRNHTTFNRRLIRELLQASVKTLCDAKSNHDNLEKYYIDSMDFKKLTKFTEYKAKQILKTDF